METTLDLRSITAQEAEQLVAGALDSYGIRAEEAMLELIKHRENFVYRLASARATRHLAVRLHRPGLRNDAEIHAEMAFLGAAGARGIMVPQGAADARRPAVRFHARSIRQVLPDRPAGMDHRLHNAGFHRRGDVRHQHAGTRGLQEPGRHHRPAARAGRGTGPGGRRGARGLGRGGTHRGRTAVGRPAGRQRLGRLPARPAAPGLGPRRPDTEGPRQGRGPLRGHPRGLHPGERVDSPAACGSSTSTTSVPAIPLRPGDGALLLPAASGLPRVPGGVVPGVRSACANCRRNTWSSGIRCAWHAVPATWGGRPPARDRTMPDSSSRTCCRWCSGWRRTMQRTARR